MSQPSLTYINALSKGDDNFSKKLIDVIKLEFPLEKKTYQDNVNSKNYKKAAEAVHKIKHKISIFKL